MQAQVALVTLHWNCSGEFLRLAQSVQAHVALPFVWVVVDNGSRPEERLALESFFGDLGAPVLYHKNAVNRGLPRGYNQALDLLAKRHPGLPVQLVSADTEVLRDGWLERVLAFTEEHPQAGIIGSAENPAGFSSPVFHDLRGWWYQHPRLTGDAQGETVDFSAVLFRKELVERGLRFDEGYEVYDGHDQDLCFRVRSWGYEVWQTQAGIRHYGSAAMKKARYQWDGGGREEWMALRNRNVARFRAIWPEFLARRRPDSEAEKRHLRIMNTKLQNLAGPRRGVKSIGIDGIVRTLPPGGDL